MKYKLFAFKFVFLDDRYLFPIILNYDDFIKAQKEYDLVNEIIKRMEELPGLDSIQKIVERVDLYDNLKEEFNSIIGDISLDNIKSIDVQLRKAIPLSPEELQRGSYEKFSVRNVHLPIKKLDNFNDIDINPFVIVDDIK